MGAVTCERWLTRIPRWAQRTVEAVFFAGLLFAGGYFFAGWVPFASSGPLRDFALKHSEDLREEIGWDELVKNVAAIRDSLPADQQASLGILVGNYGEQGAIEMFGPAYHLPPPISMTNSAWLRGYPIAAAYDADCHWVFAGVGQPQLHGLPRCRPHWQPIGVRNEESEYHPDILCLRSAAPALAGVLERPRTIRLRVPTGAGPHHQAYTDHLHDCTEHG